MNVKKTIASIAAIAMVASATSLAPLFTGTSISAEETGEAIPAAAPETPAEDPDAGISPLAVEDDDHSGHTTQGVDGISGSGEVNITDGENGATNVTVTLIPEDGKAIEGTLQAGTEIENYHVVIPVSGIGDGWTFKSGYVFDDPDNKDFNISEDLLRLWLPITEDGEYTIVLVNDDGEEKTVVVTTKYGTTTVVDPGKTDDEDDDDDENEDNNKNEDNNTEDDKNDENDEDDEDDGNDEDDEDDGNDEDDEDDGNDEDDEDDRDDGDNGQGGSGSDGNTGSDDNNTSASNPVTSNNPVNSSADTAPTVSSPAEIASSRNENLTINAAETGVTSQMLTAFANNKNTKTLTLQYTSSLKIAIDKDDVSDASANLDFSISVKSFLPASALNKLDSAAKIVQLDFAGTGELNGVDKVTVKSRVGVKYTGQTATIYEYVNGKLVKIGTGKINGAGIINFNTDHFGQFVIAVEE